MRFISFYRGCFIRIIAFPGSTFFSQETWLTLPNTASKSFNQVLFAIELTGVSWDFGPLEFKNIVIVSHLRSVLLRLKPDTNQSIILTHTKDCYRHGQLLVRQHARELQQRHQVQHLRRHQELQRRHGHLQDQQPHFAKPCLKEYNPCHVVDCCPIMRRLLFVQKRKTRDCDLIGGRRFHSRRNTRGGGLNVSHVNDFS